MRESVNDLDPSLHHTTLLYQRINFCEAYLYCPSGGCEIYDTTIWEA